MSVATRRALYGKMSGDSTLNNLLGTPPSGWTKSIYYFLAPSEATFPYVIFQKQAGTPTYAFDEEAAMDSEVWTIKGVDRSDSADAADNIISRVKVLLNDAALSISGETQLYLRYESDVDFAEEEDGVVYRHAGAQFRLTYA